MGVLSGTVIVALEQAVAAPFATRQLADLGARVIKIERPGTGDFARHYDHAVHGQSSHFVWLNRNKESLALDLKMPGTLLVLHKLLSRADVFIENLAPGACERLGLGHSVLAQQYPNLVTCSVSGYGAIGPYKDRKAYDLLVQCETGLVSVTGTAADVAKVGISIADIAAGMYAYSGILTALLARDRMGEAKHIEISLFEALGEWMGFPVHYVKYSGAELPRTGARHATIAPYGPFRTGDGKLIQLGIQNEREFQRFCTDILGTPELATDPRFADNVNRCANLGSLTELIEEAFARYGRDELAGRLDQAQIANARLNTVGEFINHPSLRARDRWQPVVTAAGVIEALIPPVTLSGEEPRMDGVPTVGQHTEAILHELGLNEQEIAWLGRESGAGPSAH